MCGADGYLSVTVILRLGSPPRVRSRPEFNNAQILNMRITSACAEQTSVSRTARTGTWDHLRVCGADDDMRMKMPSVWGSPPRVRSRPTLALNPP